MLMGSFWRKLQLTVAVAAALLAAAVASPCRALAVTTLDYDPTTTINPVADNITRLNVNKLRKDSREHVAGAHMVIIEKETGEIVAEWTTDGSVHEVARNTDDPRHGALNVDTVYILRELEAPEGYAKAADTEFVIHSDDFNTSGEIISGPDAESEQIRGSGPEQAFVINLYDDLAVNAGGEQEVVRRTDTETQTEVRVSNERTETRTTTNNSSYGDSRTITNSSSNTTSNSVTNTNSTSSTTSSRTTSTTSSSTSSSASRTSSGSGAAAGSSSTTSSSGRTSTEALTQTGDATSNAPAAALAVAAAGAMAAAVVLRRRR